MNDPDTAGGLRATHLADQRAAAAADARAQALELVTNLRPGEFAIVEYERPAPWLLEAVDRHNQVATGDSYSCPHDASPHDPAVVNAAVWQPGYLACSPCTRGGIFDRPTACSPCATPAEVLYPARYQVDNIVLHFALCRACLEAGR